MSFSPVAVPPLVEQHASDAAFLWTQRSSAVASPDFDLEDLADLDERIDANLDGLRLAGETGWQLALEGLEDELDGGEAFVAAKLALDRGDMRGVAQVLDLVEGAPEIWSALPSAISFCEFERIERALKAMVGKKVPGPLRAMGIAGYGAHRRDPGTPLSWALVDDDRALRLRALEAVADLGVGHLGDEVQRAMSAGDDEQRYWACRAAALSGDPAGITGLKSVADGAADLLADRATMLAACLMDPSAAHSWIGSLDTKGLRRRALIAAAAAGLGQLLPWVVACMDDEEHARIAGYAFYAATGVEIDDALEAEAPEQAEAEASEDADDDQEVTGDPDEDLPWPEPEAVAAHLREHPYDEGRLLLGKPIEGAWLETVLRQGLQPLRQLAAWHRRVGRPHEPTFPIDAPAWVQQARLAGV